MSSREDGRKAAEHAGGWCRRAGPIDELPEGECAECGFVVPAGTARASVMKIGDDWVACYPKELQ